MRGTTQLGGRILPLECARRGTSANSRPVIRRMHFGRFAPSTGSLVSKLHALLRALLRLIMKILYCSVLES